MPCWLDLWDHYKHLLLLLALLTVYVAFTAFLLWAPKFRKRWQRIASRVIGAIAVLPLIAALPVVLLGLMITSGNPPTQSRVVQSPSGQEAKLNYSAGFLGRDYTEVTVKSTGCCRHIVVFWHAGPGSFDDMQIEWVDDRHLQLTYHARSSDQQHCEQRVGEINIVCTSFELSK